MTKIEFLNRLEPDKIVEDIAHQLKKETIPLVLWGCGDVANSVYRYLKMNQVKVDLVWDDGDDVGKVFHGVEIANIQSIQKKFQEFNVILGHSQYDKGVGLEEQYSQINKVYWLSSVSYEQNENVSYDAITAETERFVHLCDRLDDVDSVNNLIAYLNTKLTGNAQYVLDVYREKMSFYSNDVFELNCEESYLDIGAYNGDTVRAFVMETGGRYKEIMAVEPDDSNFEKLVDYIAEERLKNVIVSKNGAWNCRKELRFCTGNEEISSVDIGSSILQDSNITTIHGARLDHLFDSRDITFLKINYYTGVKEALEGCEGILRRNRPKMAISVGFDIYNILELTEFIETLNLGYRLFLRFNRAMSSAFTLYAVAEKGFCYEEK